MPLDEGKVPLNECKVPLNEGEASLGKVTQPANSAPNSVSRPIELLKSPGSFVAQAGALSRFTGSRRLRV